MRNIISQVNGQKLVTEFSDVVKSGNEFIIKICNYVNGKRVTFFEDLSPNISFTMLDYDRFDFQIEKGFDIFDEIKLIEHERLKIMFSQNSCYRV